MNVIHALPEKIDEYYKAILSRYAADTLDGEALLAGLYTFAAARDYLTLAHIKFINKLGDATVHRIGSTLKEVLYENPLTETVLDYQLFHESFREYLEEEKTREVSDAAEVAETTDPTPVETTVARSNVPCVVAESVRT